MGRITQNSFPSGSASTVQDSAPVCPMSTRLDGDPSIALQGLPDASLRDGLLAMFADYTAHGFHGGNSLALRTILGRTPRSLNDFFAELAR